MKEAVCVKKSDMGFGIFAAKGIPKDEVILEFKGPRVKIPDMTGIPQEVWDHLFNVGLDEYIMAREPGVRTNHSCNPNAGIVKDVLLVAMRDIKKGEEITFDYSTVTADNWQMQCRCGSPNCRKMISNYVDLPAELKKKYDKYTPDWVKAIRK
jgi:SET domain-containing protein